MMDSLPISYPITGVCVVADPTKCPPHYEVLLRSEDRKDDCDLWKDGLFRARVARYLCVTREYRNNNHDEVLIDIVINNEKDLPPPGFRLIENTVDTREKATRKKQICIKTVIRSSTTDAISELILLSRQKRPPTGYTLVGEINGLALCFKMGTVPADTVNNIRENSDTQGQAAGSGASVPYSSDTSQQNDHGSLRRQESLLQNTSPLYGVPFQLGSRFQDLTGFQHGNVTELHYRSLVDIEREYDYPFRLERQAAQRLSPTRD